MKSIILPIWISALGLAAIALWATASFADQDAQIVPEPSAGSVTVFPIEHSDHLESVPTVWVWTPPGYSADSTERYPVLYMHDGQNLFDPRLSNFNKEWRVDETITRMAARGDLRNWIVVGIRSPDARWQALFPQKLYGYLPHHLTDAMREPNIGGSQLQVPLFGDAYLSFLVSELKPAIDARFATLTGPEDTAIMGSSMGGLISLYAIAEYPEIFGQAAGLSTHLPLVNPEGRNANIDAPAIAEAFGRYFAATRLNPDRNRIYVDHGTATLDASYPPYFAAFDRMMEEAGWALPAYESRVFYGAEHEENAWAQRLDIPLSFLDSKDP